MSTTTTTSTVKVLASPTKSALDKKDYQVIELPNGLRALLVSDTSYSLEKLDAEEAEMTQQNQTEKGEEEGSEASSSGSESENEDSEGEYDCDEVMEEPLSTPKKTKSASGLKKSAAGLCVGMGSFSDPKDLPGLAHFLEHMVFMGSDKYPDENAFDSFIQKHGGFDNAHTDCEHTTFYFEIQRKDLAAGLDMFAGFFINPLMKQEAMQREREAVDSEFQMALPSDYNRKAQIYGSLAKPNHPMGKFMWGNFESLQIPGVTDQDVHKKLHAFKDRHYTAQSMTLVVQAQETLETLQDLVVKSFEKVPNNGQNKETFANLVKPFDTPDFHKIYKVAPVKNVYQLDINWSLPPLLDKFREKPLHYLSWIIGHEGNGSLIAFLRKKVWALSLMAGNGFDGFELNQTHSAFGMSIVLTKSGFDNLEAVLDATFSYLKMLRSEGPSERIFKEIQEIEKLNFEFMEEPQPMDNVENLAENMQVYPPEMILTGGHLMMNYDPDLIANCASHLVPEKANFFLMAKEFGQDCDKTETWFGTKYKVEDIPEKWEKSWQNVDLNPEFHLPPVNEFIAKDLAIKKFAGDKVQFPVKIASDPSGELFFKQDDIFNQPRAIIKTHVTVPAVRDSLKNAVCFDLLLSCLGQQMIRDVYPADIAQLEYDVTSGERGIGIKVSGLNDKLVRLLETILKHFKDFEANFTKDMFEAVRDQVKKEQYNHFIKANKLVRDVRLSILQDVYWTKQEKHAIISTVTFDDVKEFYRKSIVANSSDLYIQTLVQGNMSKEDALNVFNAIKDCFVKAQPGEKNRGNDSSTMIRCAEVPEGSRIVRVDGFNPKDSNTLVTNYYQLGLGNLQKHVFMEVAGHVMEEPCFDVLRTKEQLGYTVFSMLRNTYGVLGMSVTVNSQATKFTPDHVDERIESFLEWFVKEKLEPLSDEEFSTAISTLIKEKGQADVTLNEEFNRNWSEISSMDYCFDRLQKEIALLEKCDKAEMIKFFASIVTKDNPLRRKLSCQVVGSKTNDVKEADDDTMDDGEGEGEEELEQDDHDNDKKYDFTYHTDIAGLETSAIDSIEKFKQSLNLFKVHHINE